MRLFISLVVCGLLTGPVAAQEASKTKQEPIPSRPWHCFAAGALIEGSCLGVKDNSAIIRRDSGTQIAVPLELFHPDEQKTICEHFGLEAPKVDPPDFSGGPPWNAERGGVIVFGKIVGRDGDVLQVTDGKGRRFRVPFALLASGAQEHAKLEVTALEGKPYQPKIAAASAPAVGATASQPPPINRPAPQSRQGQIFPPTVASPPAKPAGVPAPKPAVVSHGQEPRGEVRSWKSKSGMVLAEGRFVGIEGPAVRLVLKNGRPGMVPLELLTDADRQYAETLAKGGEPAKVPAGALAVASDHPRFFPTQNGKSLLLFDGNTVHVLSSDGRKELAKHELPGEVAAVGERNDCFVVAIGNALHLLDKTTFQAKAKHELWRSRRIRDLSLDPTRRVTFVSVEGNVDDVRNNPDERQRVLAVDERSGDPTEPGDVFASWIIVDPTGKYLYAGYGDVYKTGSDLTTNGDGNLLVTPNYANVDTLSRFRIEKGRLELDDTFKNAGANGQGLVLSPDGRRIAYLSYAGYPTFSGNVAALDAINFKRKPVSFAMKGRSDCKRMVYHGTLDLVASPAANGAVIYDSTTGELAAGHLADDPRLRDVAVHALSFTPDGKHLSVVVSKGGGDRYLHIAELKLSPRELARLETGR